MRNQHPWNTRCSNFQTKGAIWVFAPKFALKWILRLEFEKSNSKYRISILEILCEPISDETEKLEFLGLNLPKYRFSSWNIKNLSLDSELASWRHYIHQFPEKTDKFEFLGLNSPKNWFSSRNFKNLSLDLESASLRY